MFDLRRTASPTDRLTSLRLMDENAVAYSRAAIEDSRRLIAKADECLAVWAAWRPIVSALAAAAQGPACLSSSHGETARDAVEGR